MPDLDAVVPILNVSNVATSLEHYVDVFGFERPWHWGHPPTFGGVRTSGSGEVQFCQDGQGQRGTWLSVWVDDVDALYERLRSAGADVRQQPTTFEWGVRELNVADPDGHRIRFSMSTDATPDGRPFPGE
jgi:uncharacterized glyoxalase superfamily protein PhnB